MCPCRVDGGLKHQSIFPESFEPIGSQLCVANRMSDVLVPEVVLKRAGVVPVVGELEPAGVAEHVGVDGEANPGLLTRTDHELSHVARGHRTTALGREEVRPLRPVSAQLPQSSKLRSS